MARGGQSIGFQSRAAPGSRRNPMGAGTPQGSWSRWPVWEGLLGLGVGAGLPAVVSAGSSQAEGVLPGEPRPALHPKREDAMSGRSPGFQGPQSPVSAPAQPPLPLWARIHQQQRGARLKSTLKVPLSKMPAGTCHRSPWGQPGWEGLGARCGGGAAPQPWPTPWPDPRLEGSPVHVGGTRSGSKRSSHLFQVPRPPGQWGWVFP